MSIPSTGRKYRMVGKKELPRYKCHKEVHALKISVVDWLRSDQSVGWIVPSDAGFAGFEVSKEYMQKHKPEAGGYYVVYEDGYKSYSPAKAFEDGYTLVGCE